MPDPPPPPPDNPEERTIGIVTYHDDAEEGKPYYQHWAIVIEENLRQDDQSAGQEIMDSQRMTIIHFRDYTSKSTEQAFPKGVQVFSGESRVGDLFDKMLMVGKIHISQISSLIQLAYRLANQEAEARRQLTCQSFVELMFESDEMKGMLLQRKEYRPRLYGRFHLAPPPSVSEHSYCFAGTDIAGNPMYK